VSTAELAEEAPDFVAAAFQKLFDEYADLRLEAAAAAVEDIAGAAGRVRALKQTFSTQQAIETIKKSFGRGRDGGAEPA
jgi:hypothetical protein